MKDIDAQYWMKALKDLIGYEVVGGVDNNDGTVTLFFIDPLDPDGAIAHSLTLSQIKHLESAD